MAKATTGGRTQAAKRAADSERHDVEFFAQRKKKDAANIEKTLG